MLEDELTQLDSDSHSPPDNNRALDNPALTLNPNKMNVESCLDYCADNGFVLAGLEYSQECCESLLSVRACPRATQQP